MSQVWFVTGASKGFGRILVSQLLAQGYQVAATSRDAASLSGFSGNNFLPLTVSLTDEASVKAAIDKTINTFGKIDVVVNNAGYGQVGALEEVSDKDARENYNVNVFGLLNVIRQVMPHLREQRSGHIINIASVGGMLGGFPGWAIYCSTKFAVVGLTEGLREEIREFGVKATVVLPGYFRTSFLGADLSVTESKYQSVKDSIQWHADMNGKQPGDPEKGVAAIIEMAKSENPPLNFLIGKDAFEMVPEKFKSVLDEINEWKELTVNTVY
ncbi:SDR family NAD(P)-dependent oxidoreductase [Chitinophaga sp.]|uniref:SDR family NAD(P)-dependent oxidoreductase n=1 Tax=Chitinophaga sp. TaxID=1869181 RepID=UPI0031D47C76